MTMYKLKYIDKGPIGRSSPGRIIELCAIYPDGRNLAVATYHGYQRRIESAYMTLYPHRIHRASFLPAGDEGKKRVSLQEIRQYG